MIALLIRDADLLDSVNGRPITFESTEFPQRLRQAAAALTASEAERERMREAIVSVIADMETGFVKCERCGSQEDTKDLDFIFDLRAALDSTP